MSTYKQLTQEQRYQIYALLKEGLSQIAIAVNMEPHPLAAYPELEILWVYILCPEKHSPLE